MHPLRPFPEAVRPMLALLAVSALSGMASADPETLVLRGLQNETLYVHIDYDRDPEIPAPSGWESWQAMEKDSFYVTDAGTPDEASHVRYTRAFHAKLGDRKGAATDYIFYDHIKGQEPHYTAQIIFTFLNGDTTESWTSGFGHHMQDDPRLTGWENGVDGSSQMDFSVDLIAGGKILPRPEKGIVFLDRRPGWIDGEGPTSPARKRESGLAQLRHGWVGWGKQTVLTVPEHASRLLLMDANGRIAWKAEALTPGARLDAPAGLRTGPIRYLWLP